MTHAGFGDRCSVKQVCSFSQIFGCCTSRGVALVMLYTAMQVDGLPY
jgi:hypothetical protein